MKLVFRGFNFEYLINNQARVISRHGLREMGLVTAHIRWYMSRKFLKLDHGFTVIIKTTDHEFITPASESAENYSLYL